jgi:hypothetical protein
MLSRRRARLLATVTAVLSAVTVAASLTILTSPIQAATTTLCGSTDSTPVAGGAYQVMNNEWNSSAPECISTDGNADFTVVNSSISNNGGAPGGYPAIYKGCHWGVCTSNSGLPVQVSAMTPGEVTTNWSTTQPSSGAYDVAYDIWYNQTPTTSGQPNAEEMMIWLNHTSGIQPAGSVVASNVSIGGHTYNIWEDRMSSWNDVSYEMTSPATSVSNLDIDLLAADSVSRGYMTDSDYLISVEAGFELWQSGVGLATNSYSVNVGGGSSTPPTSPPPTTPAGGKSCTATYSVTSSWPGGFQGQVVVSNNGGSATSGWKLNWTFPGDQHISSLWNGSSTQSGEQVTVTNANYNGAIAPGGSTTVGFTGTYNTSDAAPSGVTCTAD